MMNNVERELNKGLTAAFVDGNLAANPAYKPQFVSNNYEEGRKVLTTIEDELLNCEEFQFSVAFITMSGITPLLQTFKELEKKGVKGRILTTDYLTFSEPKALEKLSELSNITLKMYSTEKGGDGFHTKGYFFRTGNIYRIVVGSSNMTLNALTKNKEWNTRIVSGSRGEYAEHIVSEFESLWGSAYAENLAKVIDSYRTKYDLVKKQRKVAESQAVVDLDQYRLEPNSMQTEFVGSLMTMVDQGDRRALLISATGTGKTYASAFALREANPRKALFVVHREQIARQAIKSYQKVFGNTKTFGLLSGTEKDFDADYLFSTMQMMSKPEIMARYQKDEFDVIVIDEVHRAGAESYQRIMDYFQPGLWLGMTASPERTDGFDIYSLFDHNVAYEIRLQQALEEDLLCPFHYFGITDLTVDDKLIDDNRDFGCLTSEDRVSHVIEEAEYYGYSGDRVKGLIFCSSKDEAAELSTKFNLRGYRTEFICGDDSQERREDCIERLTADAGDDLLDYIFTIDIFNEGVDIPEINQVIMLRPTESPIIFVQQLGRGLRKAEKKEYVVILDFIGNYANNFMIPVALSGDRSYNKDNMRRYVAGGTRIIPGSSSIHFDEIARKQIYSSIDEARTNTMKLIQDSYRDLKYKLGRIPRIEEFREYGAIDVTKIFDKCGSYYAFLRKYEKDYNVELSGAESEIVEFLSKKFAAGKRIHELVMLKMLLERKERIKYYYDKLMEEKYGVALTSYERESVVLNLTNKFGKTEEKKKYSNCVFLKETSEGGYDISDSFNSLLGDDEFRYMVEELVDFGIERYEINYSKRYGDTSFQLYQKYTYEDVCRLLDWKSNMNALNIGGYFYDSYTKTLPVFINYDKDDDAIAYEDRFVSENELVALSKHPRTVESSDADHIYKRKPEDKNNHILLFVRKNKDDKEAKEFYFLGEISAAGEPEQIRMVTPEGKEDDAFEIDYRLDVPVRDDIYEYIVGE